MASGDPKNWRRHYNKDKEKHILRLKKIRRDFPDIYAIYNRRKYLKHKYILATTTMYPCKKVLSTLNKLMEDIKYGPKMYEIDSKCC